MARRKGQLNVKSIKQRERDAQLLELRKQGLSFDAIGELHGISGTAARKAVKKLLDRIEHEPADELRRLENERLDVALAALWESVRDGSESAIATLIKLMERRAKLLGLDTRDTTIPEAAQGHTVTINVQGPGGNTNGSIGDD